ncbi:MAG: hypothetical protein OQK32_01190, partial [Gammaproteobacteria bacterium]|nr:hypothetical protein [Gammaproteobacteria bacterium]
MIKISTILKHFPVISLCAISAGLQADESQFEGQINVLKEQMLDINQELFVLEEDLLFPLDSQINVFISIDKAYLFKPDSVMLEIDGKPVSHYFYTEQEIQALHRGGIQQLYAASVAEGEHQLTLTYAGKDASSQEYKRASVVSITK